MLTDPNLTARRLPTATAKVAYYATVLCGDRAELQVFPSLDLVPQQDGNRRHEHKNPSFGFLGVSAAAYRLFS